MSPVRLHSRCLVKVGRSAASASTLVIRRFLREKGAAGSCKTIRRAVAHKGRHALLYQKRCSGSTREGALMDGVLGFALAGFALAGSPGPATLSLAATGAAFGARRGLGYMAGIIIGMVAVMGIVATGVMGLLLTLPGATPVVAAAAAAYFIYLAIRIATAPPLSEGTDGRRQP